MALISLSHLRPGQAGTVKSITGQGIFFQRLRALGVRYDAHIAVVKRAPLGDPLEIRVKGGSLALRRREAEQILLALA